MRFFVSSQNPYTSVHAQKDIIITISNVTTMRGLQWSTAREFTCLALPYWMSPETYFASTLNPSISLYPNKKIKKFCLTYLQIYVSHLFKVTFTVEVL